MYINACSTISHQDSFQNENWITELAPLENNTELITPNYKDFIPPTALRRMSKIIRMSLTSAKDCITQSGVNNPDAIIVGTGLGCLADTEKFLNNSLTIKGLIPPTSFIQSTHNTIAGQISLELKNHNYNVTHTQNSLSFEHALIDTMLCLNENDTNILVGAADESIPMLGDLLEEIGFAAIKNQLTSGASFFMVSNNKVATSKAKLVDCSTIGLNQSSPQELVIDFLTQNNIILNDVDLVIYNSFGTINNNDIEKLFDTIETVPVEKFSGYHLTNSAFSMHLATERLNQQQEIKHVLIYNTFNNNNIGLTLLQSLEA